jgi:hypothetical protein
MGQEILYCCSCQTQLRGQEFEKGKAFRVDAQAYCLKCVPEMLKSLPSEKAQVLLKQMAGASASQPFNKPETQRAQAPGATASGGMKSLRSLRTNSPAGTIGLVIATLAIAVAILWLARGSRPPEKEPVQEVRQPPPERRPEAVSREHPPGDAAPTRSVAGPDSLARARLLAKSSPLDFVGQFSLYEQALSELKGAPQLEDAKRELESIKKLARERISADLGALDAEIQRLVSQELFDRALERLRDAQNRVSHEDWTPAITQRLGDVNRKAAALFPPIREAAVAAKRRGAPKDVREEQDRVARWGLDSYSSELDKAIAEAAPPVSPEAAALQKNWDKAVTLARGRDFAKASEQLKADSQGLREAALVREMEEDVGLLRQGAALLKEGSLAFPKWKKGQAVSLEFDTPGGAPEPAEGAVLRIDPYRVELQRGAGGASVVVPFGEIRASSIAAAVRDAQGKLPPAEARALAACCLLEGSSDIARALLEGAGASLPEKYWDSARLAREAAARPGALFPPGEREARSLFYSADEDFSIVGHDALGALKAASLLKDYPDAAIVNRNRALLQLWSQAGREYFLFPEDMTASAGFALVKNAKTESCLTAESDLEPARLGERGVELAFAALPAAEYRLWVYVGACCAETFAFSYQASELTGAPAKDSKEAVPVEPGGGTFLPVKLTLTSLKKTHASHMGPKGPARWEWISVPLSKFRTPGLKRVRFLSNQKGFSVAYGFVSAKRTAPPGDADIKAFEKLKAEIVGVKPGSQSGSGGFGRGETLTIDFEKPLDPRWKIEGAQLSEEQAHGGKKSLKLVAGSSANFVFGKEDNLPLKITMWVFDPGRKLGVRDINGSVFGVTIADGSQFCLRTCWRTYLAGDTNYSWVSTAENQWFSNWSSNLRRKDGWHAFVFDFSNPKEPRIGSEGEFLEDVNKKWISRGAIGIFFMAGEADAGPLYIDDISIEYSRK